MKTEQRKIAIIGGGFAGISAANELKRSDAEIAIIDKSNHHLFQPLLYQVATGAFPRGYRRSYSRYSWQKFKN